MPVRPLNVGPLLRASPVVVPRPAGTLHRGDGAGGPAVHVPFDAFGKLTAGRLRARRQQRDVPLLASKYNLHV